MSSATAHSTGLGIVRVTRHVILMSVSHILTVAFRTMIPSVLTAMQRIANASDPLKLHYSAIAYKPFLSLFNMTGVVADGALPPAIGQSSRPQEVHLYTESTVWL